MVRVPRMIAVPRREARGVSITAADGFTVAARVFSPATPARGTLVIHGATAAPQRIYRRFAEYASERGWRVITYDYRGVGASRPDSLRGFEATMRQWAEQDARAVVKWVAATFRGPRVSIGHSFGGQLVGLIDEAHDVDRAVMVAAQLGYFGHWPLLSRLKLRLLWFGAVPVLNRAFGYLPGRAGLGEDLPRGVARQWAAWCTSPGYMFDHVDDAGDRIARFAAPTLFLSFTDDAIAPEGAVMALLDRLGGAPVAHRRVSPEELRVAAIGHFGFFRPLHRDTLWRQAVDFLGDGAVNEIAPPAPQLWTVSSAEVREDLDYGR